MDDFLKKAGRALGDLADSAGRESEVLQLQAKLGSLDDRLEQVYVEAGKRADELLKARQIYDDELRVILERGKEIREEMMEVRACIQQLRSGEQPDAEEAGPQTGTDGTTCSECGATVPDGENFCPNCGVRVR